MHSACASLLVSSVDVFIASKFSVAPCCQQSKRHNIRLYQPTEQWRLLFATTCHPSVPIWVILLVHVAGTPLAATLCSVLPVTC